MKKILSMLFAGILAFGTLGNSEMILLDEEDEDVILVVDEDVESGDVLVDEDGDEWVVE